MDYYVSENDPETAKTIAERYGFCLVRGVFNPHEIETLEHELARAARGNDGAFPDLYSCPSLRWVMLDPRVRAIAKALLGNTLVYYRETSIVYEETPGPATLKPYTVFHCDARGTRDLLEELWEGGNGRIYPIYRFALYFRNYRDYSGGLKVAVGSHLRSGTFMLRFNELKGIQTLPLVPHWVGDVKCNIYVPPFELYNIPSLPGDLVIFNLRTFHTAGALRLRERPTLAVLPPHEGGIQSSAPHLCMPTPPGCRNAIFFDFGAPSEELDFYAKWRALHRSRDPSNGPYLNDPADGLCIKDYVVIAGLAAKLAETLNDPDLVTLNATKGAVRNDLESLLDLCTKYEEFSPHHPLFDKAAFMQEKAHDALSALRRVCAQILTARTELAKREAGLEVGV